VAWCVSLYVTILLIEFLPDPFERWGLGNAVWRRWSGAYVACAVTLFVYLLSRNLVYAAITLAIFSLLAWAFRAKDSHAEPIMLAIARDAVGHAPELAGLAVPAHAGQARAAVVVPSAARLLFPLSSIAAGPGARTPFDHIISGIWYVHCRRCAARSLRSPQAHWRGWMGEVYSRRTRA
jgi:formate dehydrogenase iron-sulfur subunit